MYTCLFGLFVCLFISILVKHTRQTERHTSIHPHSTVNDSTSSPPSFYTEIYSFFINYEKTHSAHALNFKLSTFTLVTLGNAKQKKNVLIKTSRV